MLQSPWKNKNTWPPLMQDQQSTSSGEDMAALGVSWSKQILRWCPHVSLLKCHLLRAALLENPIEMSSHSHSPITLYHSITRNSLQMILAIWSCIIHLFARVSCSSLSPDHELLRDRNVSNCSPLCPHAKGSAWPRVGMRYMFIDIEPDEWIKPVTGMALSGNQISDQQP